VRHWAEFNPGGNLGNENPQPIVVPSTDGAEVLLKELEDLARKERQDASETIATLWTRTTEKARKLALIHACSLSPRNPLIDVESVRWGAELSEYVTRKMIYSANEWVSENPFEASRKRVLRTIREAKAEGLTTTELGRQTRFLKTKDRHEIVSSLLATGEIRKGERATKGRKAMIYVAA
jgi:hypothetical protein